MVTVTREFHGPKSDGNAVDVTLSHSISGRKPILVNNIPGFPHESGDSGDMRAISADGAVYRVDIGASLTPSIGDTIYVTVASVTAHEIPAAAYSTSSGAGKVPFVRVLSEKDANNFIDGKLINFS
ncbi:MAG: hypothetical protein CL607_14940 [Anaerolineaceae bacterium]|nr:hypothetical protein [Anaerolineaceae bacterium]